MVKQSSNTRVSSIAGLAAICGLFATGFQSPPKHHDAAVTEKAAAEIFSQRCSTCHVPADLAYATDRAWVDQIKETA